MALMDALIFNTSSSCIPIPRRVWTESTWRTSVCGLGRSSHCKAATSSCIRLTSENDKRSGRLNISCFSEAQKDGGKSRDEPGSTLTRMFAAYLALSKLGDVIASTIKATKGALISVKATPFHCNPFYIAAALGLVALPLIGLFIGLAVNRGGGTSALLYIGTINNNEAIWKGQAEEASSGPVNIVNNYHGHSLKELVQILILLSVLFK